MVNMEGEEQKGESTPRGDQEPFVQPLEDAGFPRKKFMTVPGHPDVIVRRTYEGGADINKNNEAHFRSLINRAQTVFADLKKRGALPIDTQAVIGKDGNGKTEVFLVGENIAGGNMEETKDVPLSAQKDFEDFFTALTDHLTSAYDTGGDFWSDFKNDVIIYGTRPGEEERRPYIVDTEPVFNTWSKEHSKRKDRELLGHLDELNDAITLYESRFVEPVKFSAARAHLRDAYSRLLPFLTEKIDKENASLAIGQLS